MTEWGIALQHFLPDDALARPAAEALWRATLWFSAIALLVLLLRLVLRRLGASLAYQAWLFVPLTPVLLLLASSLPATGSILMPADVQALGSSVVAMTSLPTPPQGHALICLLAVWIAGALLLASGLLVQHRRYQAGLAWDAHARHWRAPDARSPALLGCWRPRLVLPDDFESRFDSGERRLIRQHEAIHLRRRDNVWNTLAAALLCLQWFNPLAHWAWRRFRLDQELSCDAAVLQSQPECLAAYARALVKAHGDGKTNRLVCQMQIGQGIHPLTERIAMLNDHVSSRIATFCGRALLAIVTLSLAGMVYAMHADEPIADGKSAAAKPVLYKLAVKLEIDEVARGDGRDIFIVESGKTVTQNMRYKHADGESVWDIQITPFQVSDDTIDFQIVVRSVGVLAKPRLIVKEGATARVTMSTPDDAHRLNLTILGTRVE